MSFDRMDQKFPALLKSLDDRQLEVGTASVSPENKSVDFKSEFVPICKMGTHLKIVRTKNDLEVQSFTGEVYLSSQRMLRIVGAEDKILYGALTAFLFDTELTGTLHATVTDEHTGHFRLLRKRLTGRAEQAYPVKIHALSLGFVKFTFDFPLEEGQALTIDINAPLAVRALPIVVEQAVVFGEESSSYRCRVLSLSEENRRGMEWHIAELSIRALKMFPPVPPAAPDAPAAPAAPDAPSADGTESP